MSIRQNPLNYDQVMHTQQTMRPQGKKLPPIKLLVQRTDSSLILKSNDISQINVNQSLASQSSMSKPTAQPQSMTLKDKLTILAVVSVIISFVCLIILPIYLIPDTTTIAIIGTNDIHGKVYPTFLFRADNQQKYKYGGLTYMSTLMNIVSNQFYNNTLYLDAGDQFQGGIESSRLVSSGQIMNDFFKQTNLKGSAIGNHEFDFGPSFLFNYLAGRQSPNLAANIKSQTGQSDFMPYQEGQRLYQLSSGIKIGVVGLTTLQTPTTTATFINGQFPSYSFLDYKDIVIARTQSLRKKGAHAIILVCHVGNSCNNDFTMQRRTQKTLEQACPRDQITILIDALPQNTLNAIVQGHRHRTAHHFYKGIPYMGTISGGYYLNFMYMKFARNKTLIDVVIEGPVPVCQKIFENTGKCNYLQPTQLATAGELVNWSFHGKQVIADSQFDKILQQKWSSKMQIYLEQICRTQIILNGTRDKQSQLGNMFTTFLHQLVPDSNFTILNTGGFRTQWYPGVVTFEQYYNMFPFDNTIATFTIKGSELTNSLNVIQSGKDLFATWGLQVSININGTGAKLVTSSSFSNGSPIDPNAIYKGVTIKYLLDGGDRLSKVIGYTYNATNVTVMGDFRSTMKSYLMGIGTARAGMFTDPLNPTIILNYI